RRAARALHERVPVPVRDRRGGRGQQRGERAEGERHVVGVDQCLVVGDDLGRRAVVVEDLDLDLAAEQAAVGVDLAGPELVAVLVGLAVGAEVTGQRQRGADHDRPFAAGAAAAGAAAAAAGGTAAGRGGTAAAAGQD